MDYEQIQNLVLKLVFSGIVIGIVMSLAGYTVLAERKVASWMQGRIGPNRTSLPIIGAIPILGSFLTKLGIFQPMADGGKFVFKEEPIPGHVHKFFYHLAPIVSLVPALMTITVVPFGQYWSADGKAHSLILADIDIGILFIFAISSLGVYGLVLAGWAANSKFPFLGGIRASAQMISYELCLSVSVLPVFMWANPANSETGLTLAGVVASQGTIWNALWMPVAAFVFLVALFAETNRLPFDMAESETELVGGFHTEYGAFKFGMFFVAEYAHVVVGSAVFTLLFMGGWNFLPGIPQPWPDGLIGSFCSVGWFLFKTCFLILFFIAIRWTVPRFRYDQVMALGWKKLLPLALINLVVYTLIIGLHDKIY